MAGPEGGFMSEGSLDELGVVVLKLNLKRKEREVEEDAVRMVLVEVENEALMRKDRLAQLPHKKYVDKRSVSRLAKK